MRRLEAIVDGGDEPAGRMDNNVAAAARRRS